MRILIATFDFPPDTGGMAVYSAAWARELAAAGARVRVIARRAARDPAARPPSAHTPATRAPVRDAAGAPGASENPLLREASWRGGYLRHPWHARRALLRELDDYPVDVVLAHTWIGWGPALAWIKGRRGQRYALAAHGAEILGPAASPWHRPLLAASFKAADRVLPVSAFTADAVAGLGISRERIAVIGNGVDPERYLPAPKNENLLARHGLTGRDVVVTVGGLVDRKGQDIVVRSMALLKESHPNLRYLVVGGWTLNGSRESDLKALASASGVADRVVFTGSVGDDLLPDYYRLGDVFALTGREVRARGWVEGFGISLLEAAACGLPIVCTVTGGVADAIHADHALVVPPEDPAATARALAKLVDDPVLRARMGAAGAAWAAERTWSTRVRAGLDALGSILRLD